MIVKVVLPSAVLVGVRRPSQPAGMIKRKMSNWVKKTSKHRDSPQLTKNFRQSIVMMN